MLSCKYCEWEPAGKNVCDDREPASTAKTSPCTYLHECAGTTPYAPVTRGSHRGAQGQRRDNPPCWAGVPCWSTDSETYSYFLDANAPAGPPSPLCILGTGSDSKSPVPAGNRSSIGVPFSSPDAWALCWLYDVFRKNMRNKKEDTQKYSFIVRLMRFLLITL